MGILSQINQNRIKSNCSKLPIYRRKPPKKFFSKWSQFSVLNGRSLTSITDDIFDFEPLTPNHLLIGEASSNQSPGDFREHEVS